MRRPGGQSQGGLREGSESRSREDQADAKVDRVVADTRKEGAEKRADARSEASEETRKADFKVALEKCETFAGEAKEGCVSSAKAKFGRS